MRRSDSFQKVSAAISNVQQSLEILQKESTANAGSYKYSYTGMPRMWMALKPLLKANGLTVIQSPISHDGNTMGDFMSTTVLHEGGEWVEYVMRLVVTRDDPQGFGSAITYAERYMIKSIFKIVTDDDNDATTQRLADGEMKKEWVRAYTVVFTLQNPGKKPTNSDFIKFIEEVYGKHPSRILAKEHQSVIDIINAFK